MRPMRSGPGQSILLLVVTGMVTLGGCTRMSEGVLDESVGMNGSFEVTESGLPVNWLVYTPKTVPTGDFDIIIDTLEYKDGKQSLKFQVRECSSQGGWHSPGFGMEFPAVAGQTYRVSFWFKNAGSEYRVRVGGVSAKEGEYDTIVQSAENTEDWTLIKYDYAVQPPYERLRFQLNILQPGTFWIDDIRIEEVSSGG